MNENNENELRETCHKMYEGFSIKCNKCGSDLVYIDSDMGFSEMSGSWGGVHIKCHLCNNEVTIYGM